MNKKTFRVFSVQTIVIFVISFISIGTFIWGYTSPSVYNKERVLPLLIVMLIILPTVLLVNSFFTTWPIIELTNKDITKRLFGKKLVTFDWNNVKDIKKIRSSWAVWIFISSSKMESNSMRKLKKRKDIIYFLETDATKKIFLNNIPKDVKNMYDQTFINQAEL